MNTEKETPALNFLGGLLIFVASVCLVLIVVMKVSHTWPTGFGVLSSVRVFGVMFILGMAIRAWPKSSPPEDE